MRTFLFLVLLPISLILQSQKREISKTLVDSIKVDVWIPFMESYAELDSEKLKSIHTTDIFRVTTDNNTVKSGLPYLDEFGGFLNQVEKDGGQLGIAFSLLTTAINDIGDLVYQTGYYEFSSKNKNDENLVVRGYGKFNIGLRKIDGTWKLFLDVDKRIDISKNEFENQKIVYRLGK
ncbi:hypothetical protein [Croceitalea rosinachiae]|uniref:Nuclear transport factor 2 family protein n=1 Tax=Croceitalea rosinachiae TaxID=3075596 RepID=A0ABU3ABX4_9FLAO|nr:hypothetical protein [Croceitalea sp. F388]MDT0607673.1 hypothetical protein [Croceitalea sp. F388]